MAAASATATGPRTAEGKARSSQNARKHGLASPGFLHVPAEDMEAFEAERARYFEELDPRGAIEVECVFQLSDAAWRLRRIRILQNELALEHGEDPLAHPDTAAAMKQLDRYRAAQEMIYYRAIKMLRSLQTSRVAREAHTDDVEDILLPPLAEPVVFAKSKYCPLERRVMREMAGYGLPGAKFTIKVDDFGYGAWVPVDAAPDLPKRTAA